VRKWGAALTVMLLAFGASAAVWAGPADGGGHRIVVSAPQAARVQLAVRHQLGSDRVSVHVTDRQLEKLRRAGIPFELVPVRTVSGHSTGGEKGKPAPGRTLPSTQVPYGIKMIYGDPKLATSAIAGGDGIKVAVLDTGSVTGAGSAPTGAERTRAGS